MEMRDHLALILMELLLLLLLFPCEDRSRAPGTYAKRRHTKRGAVIELG